jgi:hypothetical protein
MQQPGAISSQLLSVSSVRSEDHGRKIGWRKLSNNSLSDFSGIPDDPGNLPLCGRKRRIVQDDYDYPAIAASRIGADVRRYCAEPRLPSTYLHRVGDGFEEWRLIFTIIIDDREIRTRQAAHWVAIPVENGQIQAYETRRRAKLTTVLSVSRQQRYD